MKEGALGPLEESRWSFVRVVGYFAREGEAAATWFTCLTLIACASDAHTYSKDLPSAGSKRALLPPRIGALNRSVVGGGYFAALGSFATPIRNKNA